MRYSRQEIMSEIGKRGQEMLNSSNVVIIGAGALGSVSSDLLVRAGVNVKIIDRDFVELSNLQRSGIFREDDVGHPKASRAAETLKKINSEVDVEGIDSDLNPSNIEEIIGKPDLVLDATDNMKTRFLINDYCMKNRIPWIYTAGVGTEGMMLAIKGSPCLSCFIRRDASGTDTCDTRGIVNTVTHTMATLQVNSAIKILLGEDVSAELTRVDLWNDIFDKTPINPKKDCRTCAGEYEFLSGSESMTELCGSDAYHIPSNGKVDLSLLKDKLSSLGEVNMMHNILHFKMREDEITVFSDGRAIIKTGSKESAKSLYSRFIGN